LLFIFERKSPQQMMRRVPRRPTEELCDGWPTSTHVCRFGTSSDPKVVMLSSATAPTLQVQRSLKPVQLKSDLCTCSCISPNTRSPLHRFFLKINWRVFLRKLLLFFI